VARFDWTINWGHLLTATTLLVAAGASYYGIRSDLRAVEARIAVIERAAERTSTAIERLTAILVNDARQDERIRALDLRLTAADRRIERIERVANRGP
jgi:hypothetical protein